SASRSRERKEQTAVLFLSTSSICRVLECMLKGLVTTLKIWRYSWRTLIQSLEPLL
ncbi:hypothetical protein CSUI_007643, partial [Cystoisospora suis]